MTDVLQLLFLAILGTLGGVLAGVAGVGGGIVFVPTLVYVAGWDIKEAVAASFVIIVFSSLSGTIRNARSEDPVDWRAAAGVGIGTLSGLVGVGGGVVMVPLMVLGLGLSTKRAASTSLAVILFTGLVASIGYIATGFSDLLSLPPLVVGSIVGAWLGVRLRDRLPERTIRVGFAGFMVLIALRTLGEAVGIL